MTLCAQGRRGASGHRTAICLEALHHGLYVHGPLLHSVFPSDVPFYAHVHSTVCRHYPIFEYILMPSSGDRSYESCNCCQCVLVSSLRAQSQCLSCITNLISFWLYIGVIIGNPHKYSIVESTPIIILANSWHQCCSWIPELTRSDGIARMRTGAGMIGNEVGLGVIGLQRPLSHSQLYYGLVSFTARRQRYNQSY